MSKVNIIFAEGSKSAAHNLDDLRERWQLRREAEAQFNQTEAPMIERAYEIPTTLEGIEALYAEQVRLNQRVQDELNYLRAHKAANSRSAGDKARLLHKETLGAEFAYRCAFLATLKIARSQMHRKREDAAFGSNLEERKAARQARMEYWTSHLDEYAIELQRERDDARREAKVLAMQLRSVKSVLTKWELLIKDSGRVPGPDETMLRQCLSELSATLIENRD